MALHHPPISVGMPVYNDAAGLRRSIPSVLGQTWGGPVRLIVVDDGSTDDTPGVLASLAATYSNILVVRNARNQGRPFARNRIVELAAPDEYLAWCDSSDMWHPRKLELQMRALQSAEVGDPHTPLLCTGPVHWVLGEGQPARIRVPDVEGDQLYNALVGTLYPYLQAIVGRASHFQRLGGFDERLLRRQDYDFLVRFLGDDGHVVSSPAHVPVFTYIKSYANGSPESVVSANRVLRDKHQQYYERYGSSLARQIVSNQHRLVGRFYEQDGRPLRARTYQALSWLSHPRVSRRHGRAALSILRPRQISRVSSRTRRRLTRPIWSLLRHGGVVELVQRPPLSRLRPVQALSRVYRRARESGPPISTPPAPLAADIRADSATWLEIEQAYRQHGMLRSAELALRSALEQHPGEAALQNRLIELLPLRRKWADCIDAWSTQDEDSTRQRRALTYARVAWSYRELGDHSSASAVAEGGIRRCGATPQLQNEFHLNRAALVDWRHALMASGPTNAADGQKPDNAARGIVRSLGFLDGLDGPIEGRIVPQHDDAPVVSLTVNGVSVVSTSARPGTSADDTATFALNCQDLRSYLGDGDVIAVEYAGQKLPIDGDGVSRIVQTGYGSRFTELRKKLGDHTFNKFGVLRQRGTPATTARTLALYDDVATLLADSYGYASFPFYGNLLGAIREHDLIAHDIGGFDMGYVSEHHEPAKVRAEFIDICHLLLRRDYRLRVEPWSVYVRSPRDAKAYVDINFGWFTAAGALQLSFGWRYQPVTDKARFFYPRESYIGAHTVRVPGNAEEVLEQIYGPSWPVPDQGFTLDRNLQRAPKYLLTVDDMHALEQLDPDRVTVKIDNALDS
jgi:glycosyltransferase involved in cell wall biosynthesis